MKSSFIVLSFVLFFGQLSFAQTITKLWESDTLLLTPECVLYTDSVLYVSNMNGKPADKNGLGSIAKVSLQGEVLVQEWAIGMDAPKGMAAYKGFIYVSDIDRVHVVDLNTGKISHTYNFPEAKFLNDVCADQKGKIYASDQNGSAVYVMQEDVSKMLIHDERLKKVNGLYWDGDKLLGGTINDVYNIDISGKSLELFIENTGRIDGLERVNETYFIISDWAGKVHLIAHNKEPLELLNFESDTYNAADLGFNSKENIVYIPTFFGNTVAAYKIEL